MGGELVTAFWLVAAFYAGVLAGVLIAALATANKITELRDELAHARNHP
jgi:uncharacterized integral membrane protein